MIDKLWFKKFIASSEYKFMQDRPIIYFCAEYALNDTLPIYAGGLGILAGDMIREAAEHEIPFIAVGLFYHKGYSLKESARINPASSNLTLVVDKQNKPVIVTIPIQDTLVSAQAWFLQIGNTRIYLLDTDLTQNAEEDRQITDQLYASSKEVRLKQEMILGLGGLRLLEALHISPIGYHLNEGHSALLALEIVRLEMKKHKHTFLEELDNTKQHIFFTNHTLIPAGNDTFGVDLVSTLLSGFAKELQVPVSEIIKLGLIAGSSIFSMALLALRMAGKINAVSRLHAKKAQEVWKEHPMIPITNGINVKTWDRVGKKGNIWEKHQRNKRDLLQYIHKMTGVRWDEDTLLLGWARRIVAYKRPLGLFDNLQQFKELATSSDRPINVVIAGIAHQNDEEGIMILKQIHKIVTEDLKGIVVYLPDYNMINARLLISGSDVWLNTPVVGFEACGTSGMKAALNGVLPCSTQDGWVAEADLYKVGWVLDSDNLSNDILSVLKTQIVQLYYDRDARNIPQQWVKMMQNAREMVLNQFSTTTMLRKYIEEFYLPVIRIHQ
ncbi:MAG TPA: alpha-glucan family phosphorylase [Methylomirabilota bacterium]|nr:alpha-glucan family phosphorylase [Methylomirabilota bacterium]